MSTLTKENNNEERLYKNNTTSSHRLLRSAKESVIGSKFKKSSIDDGVFQFADRLWNPWSGFTKKPLLNRRQTNISNLNKVSLLKVESFVDRINKPHNQSVKKVEKVMVPIENLKITNLPNSATKDIEFDLNKISEWEKNSYAENYWDRIDPNNTQINKIGWKMDQMKLGVSSSKGNISGRRPRPNTANFFKIKQSSNVNRNKYIADNRNSPFHSNTTKNLTRRITDLPTPWENQKPAGWSFGTEGFLKRKFTIKDLVE